MKRMWIGIFLLLLVLCTSIWLWLGLGNRFSQMSRDLDLAAAAATMDNWEQALLHSQTAADTWQTYRKTAASFTDHEPLEQIDALFDELQIHYREGARAQYAAVCVHLSRLAEAVEESLSLTWWSLL